jgi:hypothetical protein
LKLGFLRHALRIPVHRVRKQRGGVTLVLIILFSVCGYAVAEASAANTVTIVVRVENHVAFTIQNASVWVEQDLMPNTLLEHVSVVQQPVDLATSIKPGEAADCTLRIAVREMSGSLDLPITVGWQTDRDGQYPFYMTKELKVDASSPEADVIFHIDDASCTRRLERTGPAPSLPPATMEQVGAIGFQGWGVGTAATVSTLVYVLVMESIWPSVSNAVWTYVDDLSRAYLTRVWTYSGNSPSVVRDWLTSERAQHPNLAGCLFVGNVPEAWYEIPAHSGWEWDETFPIDLYYMDLNGVWTDADFDGIYDGHTGDVAPEIWVGRIKPTGMGDEVSLINDYFGKNHAFRTGGTGFPKRALVYVDDDWDYMAESVDSNGMRKIYADTSKVNDRAATTAADYVSRLGFGYEWVHLQCHGWAGGHSFKIPSGWDGTVYSTDYAYLNPLVAFYQFFVCSGARFTEGNYLAGVSIFKTSYGLLALGSTKTGSMLYFEDFYTLVASSKDIGTAFRTWFVRHGEEGIWTRDWFYGLAIIGDPALQPEIELGYDDNEPNYGWTVGYPGAAAVKFTPPVPFVITKIRVNGWWSGSGTGTFYMKIWDIRRNVLHQGSYRYDQYFNSYTSWAKDLEVPDIVVDGDYYIVIAPNPSSKTPAGPPSIVEIEPSETSGQAASNEPVLWISIDTTIPSYRSYGANIEAHTIDYGISDFNFMIRSTGTYAAADTISTATFYSDPPTGTITADGLTMTYGTTRTYRTGARVHVIANAPSGCSFSYWETSGVSVDNTSSADTCMTVSGAGWLKAHFKQPTVQVNSKTIFGDEFSGLRVKVERRESGHRRTTTLATPFSVELQGLYKLTAPSSKSVNGVKYYFARWEDGSGTVVSTSKSLRYDVQYGTTLYAVYGPKQYKLTVYVKDTSTRKPVVGATVEVTGTYPNQHFILTTGSRGKVIFNSIYPQTLTITITKDGYQPFTTTIILRRNTTYRVYLIPVPPTG